MSTGSRPEPGVRWVRPPEFEDDLDVADFYETLLREGEVTLTREIQTPRDEGEVSRPRDLSERPWYWVQERVHALARRAAEDGYKVQRDPERSDSYGPGKHRQTRTHNIWRKTEVLLLDGPLTPEIADAAAPWREHAQELFVTLRERGKVDVKFTYTPNALLPGGPDAVIEAELERLAVEAGLKLHWDWVPGDDIGVWVRVVE